MEQVSYREGQEVNRRRLWGPWWSLVWAALIVSRVKMRVWESDHSPAHVFVDSILTKNELPVGSGLGKWRLVCECPHGVEIKQTGWFGAPGALPDKHAGVACAPRGLGFSPPSS